MQIPGLEAVPQGTSCVEVALTPGTKPLEDHGGIEDDFAQ